MGNKATASTVPVAAMTDNNNSTDNDNSEQKELGWNYRVTDEYVFFMEGFLHQWYKAPMTIDNFTYNCCEQYMMVRKAQLFNDPLSLAKIEKSQNPLDQKTLGRSIRNFNEDTWKQHRFDIVYQGNLQKFRQNKQLREKLLSYPTSVKFVNANPGDIIWGVGVGVFDPKVVDKNNWRGENLLGEVVTKVRDTLLEEELTESTQRFVQSLNGGDKPMLLTSGYVRLYVEKAWNKAVPAEIVKVICEFFGMLLEDVRFTVFNARNCQTEKDGLICKTSMNPDREKCHRLFTTDRGYNSGVVIWKLKFSTLATGHEGAVGIMSGITDKQKVLHERPWINDSCFENCLFWSRIAKRIKGTKKIHVGETWQDGDVLCILLNCKEWYVQFYLNNQVLPDKGKGHEYLKIPLTPNLTYYPIVAFYEASDRYEVLLGD